MARSLEDKFGKVEYIGSLKESLSIFFKAKQFVYNKIFREKYLRHREPHIIKSYAKQIEKKLNHMNVDIIFSPGSIPISQLECNQPIAFWTDATFAGMINFYSEFSNLCEETIKNGNLQEQNALSKCKLALYSSDWAAKTAIDNYQIDSAKVKVVPFGANIESNRKFEDIKSIINSRPKDKCKLLFLGVQWHRKGGNIALEIAKELNSQGLETELNIAGCEPDILGKLPVFVKSHGFISKSNPYGLAKINKILSESHFLVLPSRSECFGIVFCEASSFGVPSIATNIGGIPTAIRNDINGKTFSISASVIDYCNYISNLFLNYSEYQRLALSSFNEYETRLNWDVAGRTVRRLLHEFCT